MRQRRSSSARLQNGNRSGDPATAPRCGARSRPGTPCQCPALRGKQRCRLHGGLSTGPKTAAGLARLRTAKTKHGRYSAEHRALQRVLHAYQRDGIESARSFPVREARSELLRRAREPLSCDVVNRLREMVKRQLEATEQVRLDRWHHSEG
jgi:hypothetical protein